MNNNSQQNNETREEFCGACLAIPMALVGAGTAAGAGNSKGSHGKTKKILLWGGIALTVVSVIITIIFLTRCKTCK